jgi:hypothetical protein
LLLEVENELLDLLLKLDEVELLFLLLDEDDESELLDLLLELLVELEIELLDLLVDNKDELLESAALDVTALLREFEVEELAGTIALLVCPPVARDILDELLELVLLLELIALLVAGELLKLGVGALELVAWLVFVPLNPDALEPLPPPQALKMLHNKTACAKRGRVTI